MANVFGILEIYTMCQVNAESEELGVLEANYNLHPERFVDMVLECVTSKGEIVRFPVMEIMKSKLDEFVEI